jgi:hypothetical protein
MFRNESQFNWSASFMYGFILLQLCALIAIVKMYELEPTLHLDKLAIVVTIGFIIRIRLPQTFSKHFFISLGLILLWWIIGWFDALLVLAFAFSIVVIAKYLRPPLIRNLALVGIFGIMGALVLLKHAWVQNHFTVFAIIGSIFLFRIWIYLYDKSYSKVESSLIDDLAYFLMLPNLAVLLFPAVDYTKFNSNSFTQSKINIYKRGVQWMVLGIFHLVVYRAFYYYFVLPPTEVKDLYGFINYAVPNYALVIRLSGIFHFVIGVLCLLGFDLPTTFNNYFLASSFSDLWRRMNIYFRDFMVKVFYFPIFFRLRSIGNARAMVITILCLFFISWLIHSLQWFWLKGDFPLKLVDLIYWNLFGVLVAINAVYELKKSRQSSTRSPLYLAAYGTLKIMFTFGMMSLLWSMWSANTLGEWILLLKYAIGSSIDQFLTVLLLLFGVWLIGTVVYRFIEKYSLGNIINPLPETRLASFWSMSMLAILLIIQIPALVFNIQRHTSLDLDGVLTEKLNKNDEQLQIEGYYTDILFGNNLTSPLSELNPNKIEQFRNTKGAIILFDYRDIVMRPNTEIIFKEKNFTINKWGGRDKDYSLEPPDNTIRALILGGSFVAGSGVHDHEVFDVHLENEMNKSDSAYKYEFLNFGCPSYDLIDILVQFEEGEFEKFKPDYAIYVSQGKDFNKNSRDIVKCIRDRKPIPYIFIEEIVSRSGLNVEMTEQEMFDVLLPYEHEIMEKSYTYLYDLCVRDNIVPIWVYWPTIAMRRAILDEKDRVKDIAEKIGFKIIDLYKVYENYTPKDLRVSDRDNHPNELGHRLVAEELVRVFNEELQLTKVKK